jgi:frataxin-like iron-binding protein CyaY
MGENETLELTPEQLEELQEQLGEDSNDKLVDFEIEKETLRIEKEVWFDQEDKFEFVNSKEFNEGIKLGALYGGLYSALINSGVSSENSFQIIINEQTCRHNQVMAKLDLEKTKIQSVQIQQSQI